MPLIREIYQASDFHKNMREISSSFYEKKGYEIERAFLSSSAFSVIYLFVSIFSLLFQQDERSILPLINMVLSFSAPFCVVYMLTNLAMISPLRWGNASSLQSGEFFLIAMFFEWSFPAVRMKAFFLLG